MARTLIRMLPLLALAGCGWFEMPEMPEMPSCGFCQLPPCAACALKRDEAFGPGADFGLLVFGITVRGGSAADKNPLEGQVDWMIETATETFTDLRTIELPDGIKPNQRAFVVWRVPAGVWSLRQAGWHQGGQGSATRPFGGRALATQVNNGEATYVGDLILDGNQLGLGGDEAAARAALAAYPKVTVPPLYRPLHDLRQKDGGTTRSYRHQQQ